MECCTRSLKSGRLCTDREEGSSVLAGLCCEHVCLPAASTRPTRLGVPHGAGEAGTVRQARKPGPWNRETETDS